MKLRWKVWLEGASGTSLGPGNLRLLALVAEHGTLRDAARAAGMSYRHAWDLVRSAEACWGRPLLCRSVGGHGGGHSELTPDGQRLLERWRQVEARVQDAVDQASRELVASD